MSHDCFALICEVLNKQHEILTKMTEEISMLDQIVTFTIKLNLNLQTKMKILQAVKTECIFMVLQVLNRDTETYKCSPTEDVKGKTVRDITCCMSSTETLTPTSAARQRTLKVR